jgi:hypothetical protein
VEFDARVQSAGKRPGAAGGVDEVSGVDFGFGIDNELPLARVAGDRIDLRYGSIGIPRSRAADRKS